MYDSYKDIIQVQYGGQPLVHDGDGHEEQQPEDLHRAPDPLHQAAGGEGDGPQGGPGAGRGQHHVLRRRKLQ